MVGDVVGGDEQPAVPVLLAGGADDAATAVADAERARHRVEPVAGVGEAVPAPGGRGDGVDAPQLGTGGQTAPAQPDWPLGGERVEVTGGKIRHRRRSAAATPPPPAPAGAAPRRSTGRRG